MFRMFLSSVSRVACLGCFLFDFFNRFDPACKLRRPPSVGSRNGSDPQTGTGEMDGVITEEHVLAFMGCFFTWCFFLFPFYP